MSFETLKSLLRSDKLSYILALILYLLLYFLRWSQGGWEFKESYLEGLRRQLSIRIDSLLPSPESQLLSGILLGAKKDLPSEFKIALRDTSTLHIVVVSGQNLTMIAGFFLALAGIIKRKVAIAAAFLAVIFYVVLTGAEIPVIRAALMTALSFLASILGRPKDGVWVLIVTAGFLLLINPLWISDLSFQLSFLATVGVVVISPVIAKLLRFLPAFLREDLAVTTGAQLMVTPIIAQNFHQISYVSVITNLLIGWTVPLVMIIGSLMLLATYIWDLLAQILSTIAAAFLSYFVHTVEFFASLSFAWGYVGDLSWLVWVGYYFVLAGILLSIHRKN